MARRCTAKHISSQNAQNTTRSDHFLNCRCSKIARRCGAKHICKSKCAKHHTVGPLFETVGPLFELQMSKNRMRLWHEAHLQVKMSKKPQCGTDFGRFDPAKWYAAVVRSAFASQNVKKQTGTDHFLKIRCRKIARRCGAKHICKSKCAKNQRFAAF